MSEKRSIPKPKTGPSFHVQRTRAEVRIMVSPEVAVQGTQALADAPGGDMIEARLLLSDISVSGMGLYSMVPVIQGQFVKVNVSQPIALELEGEVMWCQRQYATQRVVSSQQYDYRFGVKFKFKTPQEQETLKTFCAQFQKSR